MASSAASDANRKKTLGQALGNAVRDADKKLSPFISSTARADSMYLAMAGPMVKYLFTSGSLDNLQSITDRGNTTSRGITSGGQIIAAGSISGNVLETTTDLIFNGTDGVLYFNTIGGGKTLTWDNAASEFIFSHPLGTPASGSTFSTLTAYSDVTIGGTLDLRSNLIIDVLAPVSDQDAATKKYVDDLTGGSVGTLQTVTNNGKTTTNNLLVSASGSTFSTLLVYDKATIGGTLDVRSNNIISVADPSNPQDAATKNYVDTQGVGTLQTVTDAGNTTTNELLVSASGSTFSTLTVYGDVQIGDDLTVQDQFYAGRVNSQGNMAVNYNGPEGNGYIYFYDGGSSSGKIFYWDDAESKFAVGGPGTGFRADTIEATASGSTFSTVTASTVTAYSDVHVGRDLIVEGDSTFPGGGWTSAGTINASQINTTISWISGNELRSLTDIYINYDGADQDSSLYFYDGSSPSGQRLLWDDSESEFLFTARTAAPTFEATASGSTFSTLTAYSDVTVGRTLDVRSNVIINVADPSNPQEAATKAYVDGAAAGSLQAVTDIGNTTTNELLVSASGSTFSTLLTYGDTQVGGDLEIEGNVTAGGNIITNTGVVHGAPLRSDSSVYLNYTGPDQDSSVFFYRGGSVIGEHLRWTDASDEFAFSSRAGAPTLYATASGSTFSTLTAYSDMQVGGTFEVEGATTLGTATIAGVTTITGTSLTAPIVASNSDVYVNLDGPDGDSNLYFYENTSTQGAYLRWDESATKFLLSHGIGIGTESVNAMVTINDGAYTQFRIENSDGGEEAGLRLRARSAGDTNNMHADLAVISTADTENVGYVGFKVPFNNTAGAGYKFSVNHDGQIRTYSDLYIGSHQATEATRSLYFWENSSETGASLQWDNTLSRFALSHYLGVTGNIEAYGGDILSQGNIYINSNGPDGDSFLYFYDASTSTGAGIKWDDSESEFLATHRFGAPTFEATASGSTFSTLTVYGDVQIGDDLTVQDQFTAGVVSSQGNMFVNKGGPEGNGYIYFFDGGSSSGKIFYWDDAESKFAVGGPGTGFRADTIEATASGSTFSTVTAYSDVHVGRDLIVEGVSTFPGSIKVPASGSTFSTLTAYGDTQIGGDLEIEGNVTAGGNIITNTGVVHGAPLRSDSSVYLNYTGPDQTSGIYFYDGGSVLGESFLWTDATDEFVASSKLRAPTFKATASGSTFSTVTTYDDMTVGGTLSAADVKSKIHMYLNVDGPEGDSTLYFYDAGSPTGAYLTWLDSSNSFSFNQEVYSVQGLFVGATTTTDSDARGIGQYSARTDDFLALGTSYYALHYGIVWGIPFDDGNSVVGANCVISNYWGISTYTGGIERMRINKNGEIGIGKQATHAGTFILDVAGNVGIDGTVAVASSGSTFSTVTAYSDMTTGGTLSAVDVRVTNPSDKDDYVTLAHDGSDGYINSNQGDLRFQLGGSSKAWIDSASADFITAANLRVYSDIYVNYDGPDGDSFLYFYDASTSTGAGIKWDDSESEFLATHRFGAPTFEATASGSTFSTVTAYSDMTVGGTLSAATDIISKITLKAGTNLHLNYDGPDADSYVWFYEDSSAFGAFFQFANAANRFHMNHGLSVDGDFMAYGPNIYVNFNGTDSDQFLYFYEQGTTGASLKWDNTTTGFELSHDIRVPASGSSFSTLTTYGDSTVGGTLSAVDVRSKGHMYLNTDGPDGDSFLYFYDASSPTGAWLYYADASDIFHFSKKLSVNGDIYAWGNIYVNQDGGEGDSAVYFYESGVSTGASLLFDDSENLFEFNHTVRASSTNSFEVSNTTGDGLQWDVGAGYTKRSAYIAAIAEDTGTWGRMSISFGTGNDFDTTTDATESMRIRGTGGVEIYNGLDMGSNKITNVTDPTADQDAATKAYVDVLKVIENLSGNVTSGSAHTLPESATFTVANYPGTYMDVYVDGILQNHRNVNIVYPAAGSDDRDYQEFSTTQVKFTSTINSGQVVSYHIRQ